MDTRYRVRMRYDFLRLEYKIIPEWIEQSSSVLDLGCGDGKLLSLLIQEKQVRAQGIEIDEQAIHHCVAKGLSVFQQDIDTGLSEYEDKSFDYVILSQTLQQVKKPDFVLKEAVRVGKKAIVSFPNFLHYSARFQIFFGGKVPVTPALPYAWYDTPNSHFLSISDFIEYCNKREIKIDNSAFIWKNRKVKIFPNLFAEIGIFLLSNSASPTSAQALTC
jgi:methionine biosynthesis protein MetW